MREVIKGYHMFLPRTWLKWFIYIGYPVMVIGMVYALNRYAAFFPYVCIGLSCFTIVAVEFMLDTYMFFGIAARDTNRLEYLKTSIKGLSLLKKALTADAVRRFLSTVLILAGVYMAIAYNSAGNWGSVLSPLSPVYTAIADAFVGSVSIITLQCISCIIITCLLAELGFLLTRLFMNVWLNLAVVYILGGIASVADIYIGSWKRPILPLVLAAVCYVIIAVAGRGLILKRARESYYDR